MWEVIANEPFWIWLLCVVLYILGSLAFAIVLGKLLRQNRNENGEDE